MIYLAGPLFTTAERNFNSALAAELRKILGREIFLPQDACADSQSPADIFHACVKGINDSELVIAVLDGPDSDSGTCFEVGYANARGIPVLGVRTDFRQCSDDGGLNLMLSQGCLFVCQFPSTDPSVSAVSIAAEVAGRALDILRA